MGEVNNIKKLPNEIHSGSFREGHVQGIAVDSLGGFVYYSFTTMLLKTDLDGNPVGSVINLAGHMGCITYNPDDGRVYGSLELKHDAIGKGIIRRIGKDVTSEDAFYIVSFDVEKINRMNMDAEKDAVMKAMYLAEAVRDYNEVDEVSGAPHRYGCSGIDGIGYGPVFGEDTPWKLMVCYGIYSDIERQDNDYQLILQYDISCFNRYAQPLKQSAPHHSGPECCEQRYFLYTGNTIYGVQNLEYNPHEAEWMVAVYRGKKSEYTPFPMFMIDANVKANNESLIGRGGECGAVLKHKDGGIEGKAGIVGYDFRYGQTGIAVLPDGSVYFSQPAENKAEKTFCTTVMRYRRLHDSQQPFVLCN